MAQGLPLEIFKLQSILTIQIRPWKEVVASLTIQNQTINQLVRTIAMIFYEEQIEVDITGPHVNVR